MKPQVRAFRNAAVQVCRQRQFPFRCCVTDGRFNNFYIGVLSVIAFLNECCGSLGQGEQQAFQDLAVILKTQATQAAIEEWVNTHYP